MTIPTEIAKSVAHPTWLDDDGIAWHQEHDEYGTYHETDVYQGRYGVVRKCDGMAGWSGRVYRASRSEKAVPRGADDAPMFRTKREAIEAVETRLVEVLCG